MLDEVHLHSHSHSSFVKYRDAFLCHRRWLVLWLRLSHKIVIPDKSVGEEPNL